MSTTDTRTQWLDKFARLKVDVDAEKGRAHHKPLLLLSVLDLLEDGLLQHRDVPLSPDLVLRFLNFWPFVEPRRTNKGDIRSIGRCLFTEPGLSPNLLKRIVNAENYTT